MAENVGDHLAVVDAATGEIVQRFPTDHYPYDVILSADGHLFVSAWGGTTISEFRVLADGTLAYLGRIEVGRHPSALAVAGFCLYVALAGSDRVAIVDTRSRRVSGYLHDSAPGALVLDGNCAPPLKDKLPLPQSDLDLARNSGVNVLKVTLGGINADFAATVSDIVGHISNFRIADQPFRIRLS